MSYLQYMNTLKLRACWTSIKTIGVKMVQKNVRTPPGGSREPYYSEAAWYDDETTKKCDGIIKNLAVFLRAFSYRRRICDRTFIV